jgi:hypothetical protein
VLTAFTRAGRTLSVRKPWKTAVRSGRLLTVPGPGLSRGHEQGRCSANGMIPKLGCFVCSLYDSTTCGGMAFTGVFFLS